MFTIKDLLKATGGRLVKKGGSEGIAGLSIDSRVLNSGECFVAIKGVHFDGRDFIGEAVLKGASLVVTDREADLPDNVSLIMVDDPIEALGDIASFWRDRFHAPTVAITGSNGKSTTKQMTAAALSSFGPILKTEGNFNNLIGLPLTVLRWREEHKAAVLEMGMSAPGEIGRLTGIARPDVGLITNVSPAHLEYLHSVENVARAKGELFEQMRRDATIVVNLEDPWVVKLADCYPGERCTFGMRNDADIRFGRLDSRGLESVDVAIYVAGREYKVHLPVPGIHNVMNAMAAIAVSHVLGVSIEDAVEGLKRFEPMSMRMERIQLSKGIQLVNDSYNANPNSVKEALRTVSGAKRSGRFIAVLGDMLELGDDSPGCHYEVGEAAAQHMVDKLFAFGPHAKDLSSGAESRGMDSGGIEMYAEMDRLKNAVLNFVDTGDVILVKGSRGMQMERVVDYLIDEIGVE